MEKGISNKLHSRHNDYTLSLQPDISENNINLNVGVTNRCNCDCIFCFSRMKPQQLHEIDSQLMKRILEEGRKLGITEFNPYGNYGDPFLCREIYDYVRYAKKLGYTYIFTNTNGISLDSTNARKAIEAGFDSIRISINAGCARTYEKIHGVSLTLFDTVINNVRNMDKLRKEMNSSLILSVSFVRIDANQNEIDMLQSLIKDYVDDFIVFDLMNPRYAFTDLYILCEHKDLLGCAKRSVQGCNRVFNSIYVNQDGFMTVCALDEGGFGVVEDIKEKGLLEAWFGERFQAIRQKHINQDLEGYVCGNCLQCKHREIKPFYPEFEHLIGKQSYSVIAEAYKRELVQEEKV